MENAIGMAMNIGCSLLPSMQFKPVAQHGANLLNPESFKEVLANEKVHVNTKVNYVGVYASFAALLNIYWKPPEITGIRKIPWIPTETEIDQLIAGFKIRSVIFLMILKETMARCGEVWALEWKDLNGNVIAINAPEKNSNPRQFKPLRQVNSTHKSDA